MKKLIVTTKDGVKHVLFCWFSRRVCKVMETVKEKRKE
jgi:hypothetical protein